MEFIIQYLDIIITAVLSAIVTYGLSSLNHRRNKKKERLEREREYVDEYIYALMDKRTTLINAFEHILSELPKNKKDNHLMDLSKLDELVIEESTELLAIEAKSKYVNLLVNLIDKELIAFSRLGARIIFDFRKFKSNSAYRAYVEELITDIEDVFNLISSKIREFYDDKF